MNKYMLAISGILAIMLFLVIVVIFSEKNTPDIRYFTDKNTGLCFAAYYKSISAVPCTEKVRSEIFPTGK